jgi:hypothetical protein
VEPARYHWPDRTWEHSLDKIEPQTIRSLITAVTRGDQACGGRHHSRAAMYFFRPSSP